MLQNFLKAWHHNRGNWLLSLGVVAGLLMCLVWYFQLVPEIRLISRSVSGTLISKTLRSEQSPLVVTLRIPVLNATTIETPLVDLRAIVELHLPNESVQSDMTSLFSRSVTLRNDGTPQAVVFSEVQPGRYAVLAYIDLNNNEKFDLDESTQPLEPFRLSRRPLVGPAATNLPAKVLDLEDAGVEVVSGQATLVEFDFRQASN